MDSIKWWYGWCCWYKGKGLVLNYSMKKLLIIALLLFACEDMSLEEDSVSTSNYYYDICVTKEWDATGSGGYDYFCRTDVRDVICVAYVDDGVNDGMEYYGNNYSCEEICNTTGLLPFDKVNGNQNVLSCTIIVF